MVRVARFYRVGCRFESYQGVSVFSKRVKVMTTARELAIEYYGRLGLVATEEQIQGFLPDFLEETQRVYQNLGDLVQGYCETLGIPPLTEDDEILIRDLKNRHEETIQAIAEIMGHDMVSDLLDS